MATLPEQVKELKKLTILLLLILGILSIILSSFKPHYPLTFWTIGLIVIPTFVYYYLPKKIAYTIIFLLVGFNLLTSLRQLDSNHGYFMLYGWNLKKILIVGNIIAKDSRSHPNFNIASLLDGDTRSYPLRYVVEIKEQNPGDVGNYPQNDFLYLVARNEKEILNSNVWEVYSIKPFEIGVRWDLNDNIALFRLDRLK